MGTGDELLLEPARPSWPEPPHRRQVPDLPSPTATLPTTTRENLIGGIVIWAYVIFCTPRMAFFLVVNSTTPARPLPVIVLLANQAKVADTVVTPSSLVVARPI
jgi:hypothetical protein